MNGAGSRKGLVGVHGTGSRVGGGVRSGAQV